MINPIDHQRELLEQVLDRHGASMRPAAWAAIGAAADELLDPLVPPLAAAIDLTLDPEDVPAVDSARVDAISRVRACLTDLVASLPPLPAAACARAARHLREAESLLAEPWPLPAATGPRPEP